MQRPCGTESHDKEEVIRNEVRNVDVIYLLFMPYWMRSLSLIKINIQPLPLIICHSPGV